MRRKTSKTEKTRATWNPKTLKDLVPDAQNARRHPDRNLAMIVESLQQVGAARSIVIDESNVVRAGNGTLEAAKRLGMKKLQIVDADGETLVAVRRRGLTPAQKLALALYDNRSAELAEWDPAMLQKLAGELGGIDLSQFWNSDELRALLASVRGTQGLTDPDDVPAPRPTSITRGQLFELGRHRLLCGDSTSAADVAQLLGPARPRLMVTDPPYGVNYDPQWRVNAGVSTSKRMGRVTNDDRVDWTAAWQLFPGDIAYVWHAGLYGGDVAGQLAACSFEIRSQIIWRKSRFVLSRGHYHWQHEDAWYAVRRGRSARWAGSRKESSVWLADLLHRCPSCGVVSADAGLDVHTTVWEIEHGDGTGTTTHGTQKPVECMARPMRNHQVDEVYEPFNGSGSTLMAAELLGRTCYAIEIEPSYVQQTIDRWEAFTGKKAKGAGQVPHDRRATPKRQKGRLTRR
jgi:DNA modification methylase